MRNDLALYDLRAASWWDRDGSFAATLHSVNELRLRQIATRLGRDLHGIAAVDLGCGGGILAEPLAGLGAAVTGIDRSDASIACARAHGAGIPGLRYATGDARSPTLPDGVAHLVTCTDLLEHVDGWPAVLAAAHRLLRPGGRLYVSTINRTWMARLLAMHLAESLRLIPPGTHDHRRFIRPAELIAAAAAAGLHHEETLGQRLRLGATLMQWRIRLAPGRSTALGYACWFRRGRS